MPAISKRNAGLVYETNNAYMITSVDTIEAALAGVRRHSRRILDLSDEQIATILNELAEKTLENTEILLAANRRDLERMDPADPKYDRLLLSPVRLEDIRADLRKVAALPSPLRQTLEARTLPNGLRLEKTSVPLGVIGVIYESRPNVTFDVFALCLKSGNACVLKGSREAHFSNLAIVSLIHKVLQPHGLEGAVYLAPSEREALAPILQADRYLDLLIPRGGEGLIRHVRANAKVPVIETGAGIVHTYFDRSGDVTKGRRIVFNAKTRRPSVCNSLDTLIVHRARLSDLPALVEDLAAKEVTIFADEEAYARLRGHYPEALLAPASPAHFGTEFLSLKMAVKTAGDLEEALEHIDSHSSRHSEAIVAEDADIVDRFLRQTDAAVVYANASTAFTDGAQFGLGAEIGISTQKLHARGPMALRELTSYKWVVKGDGQVRG
jgi:glutamate-5-semialdehyde dehydrogenase